MIALAPPLVTARILSNPSSPVISVRFIPSSSQKKVIKDKNVALLFKPKKDAVREQKFCFDFHASHVCFGGGGLTLWGTLVTHTSDQAKASEFSSPGNRSHKTCKKEKYMHSLGHLSLTRGCRGGPKEQVFRDSVSSSMQSHNRTGPPEYPTSQESQSYGWHAQQLRQASAYLCLVLSWVWVSSLKLVLAMFLNFKFLF